MKYIIILVISLISGFALFLVNSNGLLPSNSHQIGQLLGLSFGLSILPLVLSLFSKSLFGPIVVLLVVMGLYLVGHFT